MERIFIYAGLELHNLQNGTIDTLPIANEVIHYDYCGRNPWSFLHMQALWIASGSESSAHYRRVQRIGLDLAQLMAPDFDLDHHCVQPR
jgi:hypothetical protein